MKKEEFGETFSEKEIELIDALIVHTIKNKEFISEEELFRLLKQPKNRFRKISS